MKKISLILILVVLILNLVFGQNAKYKEKHSLGCQILRFWMHKAMTPYKIPGMVISIFSGDTIFNIAAEGVRKIGTNDSVTINDKLHIGSCGKAITGFIAGRLVEKDYLSWDTKVLDVFPEFKSVSRAEYKNINFNDVLSNHSGVRPFTEDEEWKTLSGFSTGDNKQRRYDFTKWLLQQTPVEIDTIKKHSYSNAGFSIGAAMMEKVTGRSWDDLVKEEFTNPLNIQTIIGWPAFNRDNQPWGHWIEEGDSVLVAHSPYHEYRLDDLITPAGNYSLSIVDYTKFLQLNLKGINGKDTLLKASTYDYLHYCNFDPNVELFGFYSIGWGAFRVPSEVPITISTHTGSAGTFYCFTALYKEADLGISIIANSGIDSIKNGIGELKNKIEKYYGLR